MISLRNPAILSIFRVQATILRCFAEHLRGEGFTEIKTSKLIGTGTEGGTGLFAVEYFDSKVYLTQSPADLQAGTDRLRPRARFRDRPGVPRRKARHTPAHQRVRLPGRGDGVHRERAGPDGPRGGDPGGDFPRRPGNQPARAGDMEGDCARTRAVREDPPCLPRRGERDRVKGDGKEGLRDHP